MSDDRSEDVDRRLSDLEATIRGLTQELVEANGRIRELEERLDGDDEVEAPMPSKSKGESEDSGDAELEGIIVA